MAVITYSPDSLVCTVRTTLVATLPRVIVTPGTASPLASTTVPLISPDGVWPRAGTAIDTRRRRRIPEVRPCIGPPLRAELASSDEPRHMPRCRHTKNTSLADPITPRDSTHGPSPRGLPENSMAR